MERCEILIAGGGPAGSSCAWRLRQAGLDVLVLDRARFPRDKVCAGWVTPQAFADLELDPETYRPGRTLQPFTAFRIGVIGSDRQVDVAYDRPVSYGILRCEFDHFLLQRSGARVRAGTAIASLRREGDEWIVNESIAARLLVGAGGHFCPVARHLNGSIPDTSLVVAQEAEFPIDAREADAFDVSPERPELYFTRELDGYGWYIRKQRHVNIGFGCLNRNGLPAARDAFVSFLRRTRNIPDVPSRCWKGHAYLLSSVGARRVVDEGVILTGDAAGLAYPQSGEGIRPAIESGLIAASAIIEAKGRYTREALAPYQARLRVRFGVRSKPRSVPSALAPLTASVGRWLLGRPSFVRRVVIDRWFLHAQQPVLGSL